MSKIALSGDASGTGTFTIASPNSNNNRTLTLPDATGTVQVSGNPISGTTGSFSGDLSFNSGYGSAAVAYGCRAWVNFNGTGTVAIRASGNVTSITDNGTGDYTVNFTTALPDANYAASYAASFSQAIVDSNGAASHIAQPYSNSTSSHRLKTRYTFSNSNGAFVDFEFVYVAIFR